jgi:ABC-type transport system involved in cytochrome bd biosynthesis fused ATPase/permease subunit
MKRKNIFTLIFKMLSLIKGKVYLIVLAVLVGALGYLAAMGITFFAGLFIFKYLGAEIAISEGWLLGSIAICGFSRGALRYVEQYINHLMAFSLLAEVRDKIFSSLRRQGSVIIDDRSKGEILSIFQGDVENLEVFYAHTITPLLIAIFVETTIVMIIYILLGYQMALIAIGSYLLIGLAIPSIFYLSNKKEGREYRKTLGENESIYLNSIYGIKEVISFFKEKDALSEVLKSSDRLNEISRSLNKKREVFSAIVYVLIALSDVAMIALAARLFGLGSANSPYILLAYSVIVSSFGPVVALANLPSNLTTSFASARRILDLIETKPRTKYGDETFDFNELKVKDVSFSYDSKKVLKDVNITISIGDIVGIKGKSGSGKSTLFKLLLNFEKPNRGKVLYNGKEVEEYSSKSISENVVLFSQSTYLFKGTIEYNLRIAKPDASQDELKEAAKKAGILDYIESTKYGFKTEISELKDNLSTGEKQRLGLARIFLFKAKLILLDEATSNVDAANEAWILNQLKREAKDRAIMIISHRGTPLKIADRIYELKDGVLC